MEIYAALPLALMHTEGSNQRVREGFYRALDVAVKQQDPAYELRFLSGLFLYARWTTDINGALDIATRSKKVALQTQDPDDMALAESMLGAVNHLAGNHPVAQQHFESWLEVFGLWFALPRRAILVSSHQPVARRDGAFFAVQGIV